MSATSALLRGRAAAAALMVDTCTVTRLNPATTTTDPETGVVTKGFTTVYTGPCKIQDATLGGGRGRPTTVGEAEVLLARMQLHLPMTATGVATDDIATVTASVSDPDLVGRVFHVRELSAKSWLTARRFEIEWVTS